MKTPVSQVLLVLVLCAACDSWHGPSGGAATGGRSSTDTGSSLTGTDQTRMDASVAAADADIDANATEMDAGGSMAAEEDAGISSQP